MFPRHPLLSFAKPMPQHHYHHFGLQCESHQDSRLLKQGGLVFEPGKLQDALRKAAKSNNVMLVA
eukprot:scaffold120268_cov23-Prasinocladus_malaysianus.AAC.1